jgi:hypothetical protein
MVIANQHYSWKSANLVKVVVCICVSTEQTHVYMCKIVTMSNRYAKRINLYPIVPEVR